ncbi:MAG: ROK family protein [Syntrophobacterales bacterium]|nr:ROK family protein [Syntrophobacterales bacterium]
MGCSEVVISGDIGGTHIRLSLVGKDGRIYSMVKREINETSRDDAHVFLASVKAWCIELFEYAKESRLSVLGVGLGVAGKIDYRRGLILFSPNLPVSHNISLVSELSSSLSLPVFIENDANAFGLGEAWMGGAREWKSWLGITLGTGVGGCIFLNGKLWRGDEEAGFAGEIGHTTVIPGGLVCACGKKGCLEAYSSEGGLRRQVFIDVKEGWKGSPVRPSDPDFYIKNVSNLTAKILFKRALEEDDAYARYLFDQLGRMLGISISNVFTTLGIHRVVIGGGVSNAWDLFVPSLYEALKDNCSMVEFQKILIVKSPLADSAAILGAARCAFDNLKEAPK